MITTDAQVRAIRLRKDETERRVSVLGHSGLVLIIREKSKYWYFRWKYRGKTNVHSLGRYPEISLARARERAFECRQRLAEGVSPVLDQKMEPTPAMTFKVLFSEWQEKQLITRKDAGASIKSLFGKYVFDQVGDKLAAEIKRKDIAGLLDSARGNGVGRTVALLLSSLRQMFRFAISRELLEADPTALLRPQDFGVRSIERDRVLSRDEIVQLARNLRLSSVNELLPGGARLKDETKLALWLQLATACRIGELMNAHWRDVDLVKGEWKITVEDSGTKRHQQTVFLSDFATARFRELASITKRRGKNPGFCWPDTFKGGDIHISEKTISKQVRDRQTHSQMSRRSKSTAALALPGGRWTPHDLRRTGATLMGEAGVSPDVIERVLNHSDENRIRRTYQRQLLVEPQREAWRILGEVLEGLKKEGESAKL